MLQTFPLQLDPTIPDMAGNPRLLPDANPYLAIFHPGFGAWQSIYRLHELPKAFGDHGGLENRYISQSFFRAPNRRAVNVFAMSQAWVDFDSYDPAHSKYAELLKDFGPEHLCGQILQTCMDDGIPRPTSIIFSGRGIYAKWSFSSILPAAAAARLKAVNQALAKRLSHFGADERAVDVSRVLRMNGSINPKTGNVVETLFINRGPDNLPVCYDFNEFADEVLPFTLAELAAARQQSALDRLARKGSQPRAFRAAHKFDRTDWACKVTADLRAIVEMRWDGAVPEGQRDNFAFLAGAHIALWVRSDRIVVETREFLRDLIPDEGWKAKNLQHYLSSVTARARRAEKGEKEIYVDNGRSYDPRYSFKKSSLIDRLKITSEEMVHLSALIDDDEKYRRKKARRETIAAPMRLVKAANREVAVNLSVNGDYRAIASNAGVSDRTLRRWRQAAAESKTYGY